MRAPFPLLLLLLLLLPLAHSQQPLQPLSNYLTTQTIVSTSVREPTSLQVVDFNSDAAPDLLVHSSSPEAGATGVAILINDMVSSTTASSSCETFCFDDALALLSPADDPLLPIAAVLAMDADNDGDLDLVLASAAMEAIYYSPDPLDAGMINNWQRLPVAVGFPGVLQLEARDLDADGANDLLVLSKVNSSHHAVTPLWGSTAVPGEFSVGDTAFIAAATIPQMRVGDLDGDGVDDVAFIQDSNTISYVVNNGDRSFTSDVTVAFSTTDTYSNVRLYDVNGDGLLDVVVSTSTSFAKFVEYFANPGDDDWDPVTPVPIAENVALNGVNGINDVILADFSGNFLLDVVVAVPIDDNNDNGAVIGATHLTLTNDDFDVPIKIAVSTLPEITLLGTADFDGDGSMDCVTISKEFNSVAILGGEVPLSSLQTVDTSITLTTPSSRIVAHPFSPPSTHIDIVVADNSGVRLINFPSSTSLGESSVSTISQSPTGPHLVTKASNPALVFPDIVFATATKLFYRRMPLTGSPPPFTIAALGSIPSVLTTIDFFGTGVDDILLSQGTTLLYFTNMRTAVGGSYSGTSTSVVTAPATISYATTGDVNGDGVADIVVASYDGNDPILTSLIQVLTTSGSPGSFVWTAATVSESDADSLATPNFFLLADMTNSGWLDLVVTFRDSSNVAIFENPAGGIFSSVNVVAFGIDQAGPVSVVDIDGNGFLDIFVGSQTSVLYFTNNGDLTFSSAITFDSGLSANVAGLLPIDYQTDGKIDFFISTGTLIARQQTTSRRQLSMKIDPNIAATTKRCVTSATFGAFTCPSLQAAATELLERPGSSRVIQLASGTEQITSPVSLYAPRNSELTLEVPFEGSTIACSGIPAGNRLPCLDIRSGSVRTTGGVLTVEGTTSTDAQYELFSVQSASFTQISPSGLFCLSALSGPCVPDAPFSTITDFRPLLGKPRLEVRKHHSVLPGACFSAFDADVVLSSASFTECQSTARGGAMKLEKSNLQIVGGTDVTFGSNSALDCGALLLEEGSVLISDEPGTLMFIDNTATSGSGGAACISSSSLLVTDDGRLSVINNTAAEAAGGIYMETSSTHVSGMAATFEGNVATSSHGGALVVAASSTMTIFGASFSDNSALGEGAYGGALDIQSSTMTVENTHFSDNHAENAGALRCAGENNRAASTATLAFIGGSGTLNSASFDGGAIVSSSCSLSVSNSQFTDNTAGSASVPPSDDSGAGCATTANFTGQGGAIFIDGDQQVTFSDVTVANNTAFGDGGAFFVETTVTTPLAVSGSSVITGNKATGGGGAGIYWTPDSCDPTPFLDTTTQSIPDVNPSVTIDAVSNVAEYGNDFATRVVRLDIVRNTVSTEEQVSRQPFVGILELRVVDAYNQTVASDVTTTLTLVVQTSGDAFADLLGSDVTVTADRGFFNLTGADVAVEALPGSTQEVGFTLSITDWTVILPSPLTLNIAECAPGTAVESELRCVACTPGRFTDSPNLRNCEACPVGKFTSSFGTTQCQNASFGSYVPSTGSGSDTPCPEGSITDTQGRSSCDACPSGFASDIAGGSLCTPCNEGFYTPAGGLTSCIACTPGKFANESGLSDCRDCPPGSFASVQATDECTLCPRGRFSDIEGRGECFECPVGRASNVTGSLLCDECVQGTFQNKTGQFFCIDCSPGTVTFGNGSASCSECEAGKFHDQSTDTCESCSPGRFTSSPRQTTCELARAGRFVRLSGSSASEPCPSGSFAENPEQSSCEVCPAGRYAPTTGRSDCLKCANGSIALVNGSIACTVCSAGKFHDQQLDTCESCPAGFFTGVEGLTECQEAPVGSFVRLSGSTASEPCPAGRFSAAVNASICTACPLGTFANDTGSDECTACPPGSLTGSEGSIACTPCSAGKFLNTATIKCEPCPAGFFNGEEGKEQCQEAPIGSFVRLSGSTAAEPCPAGRFSAAVNASICTACPVGTFANETGSDECTTCLAGSSTAVTGSVTCTACSAGKFQNTDTLACEPCPAGFYNGDEGRTSCVEAPIGSFVRLPGSTAFEPCPAGRFSNSVNASSCTPCAVGTFANDTGFDHCEECPEGSSTAVTGSVTCTACSAGKFQNTDTLECEPCPAGFYNGDEGRTLCVEAPIGSFVRLPGSTAFEPCPAGRFSNSVNASICTSCPVGTFANDTGFDHCEECPEGSSTAVTGSVTCIACSAGKFQNTDTLACEPCPAGFYNGDEGRTSCVEAPIGSFVRLPGSTAFEPCPAGRFSNSVNASICTSCPVGTFANDTGFDHCDECPEGSSTTVPGSVTCTECSAGKFQDTSTLECKPCTPGFYNNQEGRTACVEAPIGSFVRLSGSTAFEPCPAGRFSNSVNASICTSCPVGKFANDTGFDHCDECPEGSSTTVTGSVGCTACSAGKFQDTSTLECKPCTPGFYNNQEGRTACVEAPIGSFVRLSGSTAFEPCPAGSFSDAVNSSSCTSCPVGRFANETGWTVCKPCPAGSSTAVTGSVTCVSCPAGRFQNTDTLACEPCTPGFYNNEEGRTACVEAPIGSFVRLSGSTAFEPCPAGSFSDAVNSSSCTSCPVGRFANETGWTVCKPCPAGSSTAVTGSVTCVSCPAGRFQNTDTLACEPCTPGFYNNEEGRTACVEAPIGSFVRLSGSTAFEPCPAGTFSNAVNASSCTPCPVGRFANDTGFDRCEPCLEGSSTAVTGSVTCVSCPAGRFQNTDTLECNTCDPGFYNAQEGRTTCVAAPVGSFVRFSGSTAFEPCPAGTFSNALNASSCTPCPVNTFANETGSVSCSECPAGATSSNEGSVLCNPCPAGRFASSSECVRCAAGRFTEIEGQTECSPAPAGFFSREGATAPEPCPAGLFTEEEAQPDCEPCLPGTFTNTTGSSQCTRCFPGTVMPNSGSSFCQLCPPGTSQPLRGRTSCVDCPKDTAAEEAGSANCTKCEFPTFTEREASRSCETCSIDEYALFNDDGTFDRCKTCPDNVECTVSGELVAADGFWLAQGAAGREAQAFECLEGYCSKGNQCASGRKDFSENPLCAECLDGHSEANGECVPCSGTNWPVVVLLVLLCFLFVAVFHLITKTSSAPLRIAMYYWQISLLLVGSENGVAVYVLEVFNFSFLQATGNNCLTPLNPMETVWFGATAPLLTFCAWVTLLVGSRLRHWWSMRKSKGSSGMGASSSMPENVAMSIQDRIDMSEDQRFSYKPFLRSLIALYLFTFTGTVEVVLEFFHCVEIRVDGESRRVIQTAPAVDCDSDQYNRWRPLAILVLMVECALVPLLLTSKLLVARKRGLMDRPRFQQTYGILTLDFKPSFFFWAIWVLLRRAILIAVVVQLADEARPRNAIAGMLCLCFLLLHLLLRPFRREVDNYAEGVSLTILSFLCFVLLLFGNELSNTENIVLFVFTMVPSLIMAIWVGRFQVRRFLYKNDADWRVAVRRPLGFCLGSDPATTAGRPSVAPAAPISGHHDVPMMPVGHRGKSIDSADEDSSGLDEADLDVSMPYGEPSALHTGEVRAGSPSSGAGRMLAGNDDV